MSQPPAPRLPPHDVFTERSVLHGLLYYAERPGGIEEVAAAVEGADFYRPLHTVVFQCILSRHARGETVDAVVVAEECRGSGLEVAPVDLMFLGPDEPPPPTFNRLLDHARIVRKQSIQRRLLELGEKIAEKAHAGAVDDATELIEQARAVAAQTEAGEPGLWLPDALDWEDFWSRDHAAGNWLIEPLVPAGRQVALYAPAKTGKSLVALDAVAAAATGRSVFGQPPADPIRVVYLDMEMTEDDVRERLEDLDYGPGDDLSRFRYYPLPALPPLDTKDGGRALAALAERERADLVVVDTMARVVEGDENAADTYRNFYKHSGGRLKAAGVSLLRLDHAGKDTAKGQRGSSAKDDDVDLVWELRTTANGVTLFRRRSRISWAPESIPLERLTEPRLSHVLTHAAWPPETAEVARLLDSLGVPAEASGNEAVKALREAGQGRNRQAVLAAQKYRRAR